MPLEVRWFSKNIGYYESVYKWFTSDDQIFEKEIRKDQYLFLPNSEDIGIKLRSWKDNSHTKLPKLEIKWRKKKNTNLDILNNRISGTLEEWVKWSWILTHHPESTDYLIDFFSTVPNGPGIEVKKYRTIKKYNYIDLSKSIERINTNSGEEGLQCEVTKINCNNKIEWSIGFEEICIKSNELKFLDAVKKLLKDFQIILKNVDSYGYPKWLQYRNFNHFNNMSGS